MRIETVQVTPDLAKEWLGKNTNNRRMSGQTIASYAASMSSGNWQQNGETVKFSTTGALLDGQHRLAGVIASRKSIPMSVAFDVPVEAGATIDVGRIRKAGDILAISGEVNTVNLAAVAGNVYRLFHNLPTGVRVPPSYIVETLSRYPRLRDWTTKCSSNLTLQRTGAGSTLMTALFYLDAIAGRSAIAQRLFDKMVTGSDLHDGDPILALRNRLISYRAARGKMDFNSLWPVFVRVIDALEAGETLSRAHMSASSGSVRPRKWRDHMQVLDRIARLEDLSPPQADLDRDPRFAEFTKRKARSARPSTVKPKA